jgi:hypothetical protein
LFGAGDAKIGKIVKGTAERGRQLKQNFLQGLPALGALLERLTKEWKATARQRYNAKFNRMEYYDGTITGLDGRPIVVPSEHQILVYLLQSDEAIMMTKAYNLLWERLSKKWVFGEDFGVVCWYHDEYTIECRKEIAQEVKAISEQCIVDAAEFYQISCPHKGDGKIGTNWYEIH